MHGIDLNAKREDRAIMLGTSDCTKSLGEREMLTRIEQKERKINIATNSLVICRKSDAMRGNEEA